MKREIITTGDGSKTIHIPEWNEQYHSKHGAINEAKHVFIEHGLNAKLLASEAQAIGILEIGFGTGLNAFLTALEAEKLGIHINYVGVEAFPVLKDELSLLNYVAEIAPTQKTIFENIHDTSWETKHKITSNFDLTKRKQRFENISDKEKFDLIYFDAFGARVQPELWTKAIFNLMYDALLPSGMLVTYAAIGQVRRDMTKIGFSVERLNGPPGKRHMLRATK